MPSRTPVTVIYFKRDLRVWDHLPLHHAGQIDRPVIPLYIWEPSVYQAPDFDRLHLSFIKASLAHLRRALEWRGATLLELHGEVLPVFQELAGKVQIEAIYAHQETGNALTYQRDTRLEAWCQANGIHWKEFKQFGVIRRLGSREGWAQRWNRQMAKPGLPPPPQLSLPPDLGSYRFEFPDPRELPSISPRGNTSPGGEPHAWATLHSFIQGRGTCYHREMSSPLTAYESCSRLSAYLSWGCISMRSVYQVAMAAKRGHLPSPLKKTALNAFIGRLHWHCHFIQKLESEPDIEFHTLNRAYNHLRPRIHELVNQEKTTQALRLYAWTHGLTGYPFVDACMRALRSTGWINFRMRAMLVSFAAYDLWLDWRDFKDILARCFIDYEPGIHYAQLQMQSGTTGINTLRIYNPIKQGLDHDPKGQFIREWVPELRAIPDYLIHTPWKATPLELAEAGLSISPLTEELTATPGVYPLPIVDHKEAVRKARTHLATVRKSDFQRSEAKRVYQLHGSRKGSTGSLREMKNQARRVAGQDAIEFSRPLPPPNRNQSEFQF